MTTIAPTTPQPVQLQLPLALPAASGRPPFLAPDVVADRTEQGRIAEYTEGTLPDGVIDRGAPDYFRTFSQLKSDLTSLAAKYPNLIEIQDIGDTSEKAAGIADRDVLNVRVTAKGINDGAKPSAFFIGGEHSREIANPELLMRFVTQLVEGYGTDPEATGLLQSRVIDIVPMMNPDGHVVVEKGFSREPGGNLMQRKNTSPPDGTDLNRNYEFHWGTGGSSSYPKSQTYRGPSAASEPEVVAVQNHARNTKPGIFMDWHSYSELNLYPWGDTRDKAPDFDGLDGLARKFSTFNNYTPQQSIKLYPTSGTSKDFMYGEMRIPSFTIETGRTFHQSDSDFDRSWAENGPVMQYAAKVADAPFQRVFGPDAMDLQVTLPNAPGVGPKQAKLDATVTDADNGAQAIAAAEWTIDPLSTPGSGTALQATDGVFDSPSEQVTGLIDAAAGDKQLVYVRAQDADGNWGPSTAQWLRGESPS